MKPKTLYSKFEHLERMQIVSRMYVRNKFTRKDILWLLYTDIEMREEMSVGHVGLQGWDGGGQSKGAALGMESEPVLRQPIHHLLVFLLTPTPHPLQAITDFRS